METGHARKSGGTREEKEVSCLLQGTLRYGDSPVYAHDAALWLPLKLRSFFYIVPNGPAQTRGPGFCVLYPSKLSKFILCLKIEEKTGSKKQQFFGKRSCFARKMELVIADGL